MPILLSREEFELAMDELNKRLGRIEQALIELKPCKCEEPKEVKKVIPLKKK